MTTPTTPTTPEPDSEPHYDCGTHVRYQGRAYRILSINLHGIAGPHYRLKACGDYPNEDLTSHRLLSPAPADGGAR